MRISKETTSKTNQRTRNAAGEQVSLFRFPASLSPKIPNEQNRKILILNLTFDQSFDF